MAEFERLENSALAPLLRLVGTFSDAQRQSAAGCDMFVHCASQAARPEFYAADGGGLDCARYAQKVQLVGVQVVVARAPRGPKIGSLMCDLLLRHLRVPLVPARLRQISLSLGDSVVDLPCSHFYR